MRVHFIPLRSMKNLMLLFVAIISATCLAQAQNHYRVTNLGVLPGDSVTVGYGLNDLGDVVGSCTSNTKPLGYPPYFDAFLRPFLYHAGSISNFAPNGIFGDTSGVATGINNSGHIVGNYNFLFKNSTNSPGTLAFIYNGNFKPLTDGHHASYVTGINNNGVLVGYYTPEDQILHPPSGVSLFQYTQAFEFINNPAGWGTFITINTNAFGTTNLSYIGNVVINDNNQIAGSTYAEGGVGSNNAPEPWLYINGQIGEPNPSARRRSATSGFRIRLTTTVK